MVGIKARVGPKGQIVIPKVFRDEFGIVPGDDVLLQEDSDTLRIEKPRDDVVQKLAFLAKKVKLKKFDIHAIEEEYEERWKKSRHST